MFGLILLSVALIVVGQLNAMQHAALMTFYDAVGAFVDDQRKKKDFCFFFTSASGCNNATCPRFSAGQQCIVTTTLNCTGSNVTRLCVT